MDWFWRDNFHRTPPWSSWKNPWFPVKIFPWKPIHYSPEVGTYVTIKMESSPIDNWGFWPDWASWTIGNIKKLHGINYEQFTGKLLEVHTRMSSKYSVLLLFNLGTFLVICWILELKYSICCIFELNLLFAGYLQHFGTRICMLESLIWTNFGAKIATLWSLNLRHVGPWKPWIAASWRSCNLHGTCCMLKPFLIVTENCFSLLIAQ